MCNKKEANIMDLISVIVPIYNGEQFLNQCIESIISQTYKNLEIILINDGSTDRTLAICKDYQKHDKRIKIISQKNSGSVAARMSGLRIAAGKYIGFVDADDYIDSNMYEELHFEIVENKVDFVHSGMIRNGREEVNQKKELIDFGDIDKVYFFNNRFMMNRGINFVIWSKLFCADIIKQAYERIPEEQSYGEDLLCMMNVLLSCKRLLLKDNAYYHYREYEGSMSHIRWRKMILEESKLYMQGIKLLEKYVCEDKYKKGLEQHYRQRIKDALNKANESGVEVSDYFFQNPSQLEGKRIVIYGAGGVGRDYYKQIRKYNKCEVVAWIDKDISKSTDMVEILGPEKLPDINYDALVIAVKRQQLMNEIKEELLKKQYISSETEIIWEEPGYYQ